MHPGLPQPLLLHYSACSCQYVFSQADSILQSSTQFPLARLQTAPPVHWNTPAHLQTPPLFSSAVGWMPEMPKGVSGVKVMAWSADVQAVSTGLKPTLVDFPRKA